MMSFTETSQLLQKELMNDYSYRVDGIPPMNDSQYDFNHVQSHPPPSAYMQRTAAGAGGGGRASAMPQSRGGFGRNTETARPMTSNRAAGKQESANRTLTEGDDALREDIKRRQREAARRCEHPWGHHDRLVVIDSLNHHGFPRIGSELEIAKSKEPSLMACAATNLSFLYFLEAEHVNAEKYADIAVKADRYNARALVNKGNCMFMNDEFERAKEVYLEAIGVSADCLEAIYNLGLVNMHIGHLPMTSGGALFPAGKYQEALLAFDKLHSITHVNCDLAAHEWFSLLVTSPKGRPTDPGVLARLANLFNKAGDETQAFHYHLESYRYWPVDMNVITWLGIYYVKQEMYEIEPNEVKWRLMVASCYRRMGAYPAALKLYEDIHKSHPNDIECVRYLITICKEMKQKYDHYAAHLRKLERLQEAQNGQGGRPMGTVSAIDDSPHDDGGRMGFGGSRGHFDEDDPPPAPADPPRPPMAAW
eukprot:Skav214102  [mRNA]  locus=scaffold1185:208172:218049:- [translate_table: standard]